MGFFKTSLAVATGILGAIGIIAAAEHLSESEALDKIKDRALKAASKDKTNKTAAAATN